MRNHEFLGALSIWMALAACGGSSSPPSNGFPQPAGTVAVNFTADDTANKGLHGRQPPVEGLDDL